MCGITKRTEIGVVGRNDNDAAARCEQPMELFNRGDNFSYVFDDVRGADLAEGVVAEREREMIQACDHIRPSMRVPIQAYGAGVLIEPAPYVKYRELEYRTSRADACLRCRS